jgi:hypothetical protein
MNSPRVFDGLPGGQASESRPSATDTPPVDTASLSRIRADALESKLQEAMHSVKRENQALSARIEEMEQSEVLMRDAFEELRFTCQALQTKFQEARQREGALEAQVVELRRELVRVKEDAAVESKLAARILDSVSLLMREQEALRKLQSSQPTNPRLLTHTSVEEVIKSSLLPSPPSSPPLAVPHPSARVTTPPAEPTQEADSKEAHPVIDSTGEIKRGRSDRFRRKSAPSSQSDEARVSRRRRFSPPSHETPTSPPPFMERKDDNEDDDDEEEEEEEGGDVIVSAESSRYRRRPTSGHRGRDDDDDEEEEEEEEGGDVIVSAGSSRYRRRPTSGHRGRDDDDDDDDEEEEEEEGGDVIVSAGSSRYRRRPTSGHRGRDDDDDDDHQEKPSYQPPSMAIVSLVTGFRVVKHASTSLAFPKTCRVWLLARQDPWSDQLSGGSELCYGSSLSRSPSHRRWVPLSEIKGVDYGAPSRGSWARTVLAVRRVDVSCCCVVRVRGGRQLLFEFESDKVRTVFHDHLLSVLEAVRHPPSSTSRPAYRSRTRAANRSLFNLDRELRRPNVDTPSPGVAWGTRLRPPIRTRSGRQASPSATGDGALIRGGLRSKPWSRTRVRGVEHSTEDNAGAEEGFSSDDDVTETESSSRYTVSGQATVITPFVTNWATSPNNSHDDVPSGGMVFKVRSRPTISFSPKALTQTSGADSSITDAVLLVSHTA